MEAGIEVAQWFAEEAARVYSVLGGDADSDAARQKRVTERLLEWIHSRGGCVTVRDVTRGPPGADGTARIVSAARFAFWKPYLS